MKIPFTDRINDSGLNIFREIFLKPDAELITALIVATLSIQGAQ